MTQVVLLLIAGAVLAILVQLIHAGELGSVLTAVGGVLAAVFVITVVAGILFAVLFGFHLLLAI